VVVTEKITVWDPLVRVLHWSLVAGITVAWVTYNGPAKLHDGAGYAVLIVIAVRLVWGIAGPKFARFRSFVRGPSATLDYAKSVGRGTEARHLGHNPLGGWMIIALLLCAAAAGLSGWLLTTDAFWGIAWMEAIHDALANLLLALIALHVTGVIFTSIRQQENLVRSMIDGQKERRVGDQ